MDENVVNDFIEHHGVLGMKWGRRGSGSSRGPASAESRRVSDLKNRPKHTLTNKQLKTVNERISLERNFSKMNPSTVKKGAEAAAATLATIGIGISAFNMITSPAGKAAISAGKKFISKIKHSDMEVGVDFIKHRNSLLLRTIP